MKSVYYHRTYVHKKKYIQNALGFGNDHDMLPVFKAGGIHSAKLQRFQWVTNFTNGEKCYQEKAYVNKIYFIFTVKRDYLLSLVDFDINKVDQRANKWDILPGGDKGNNSIVRSAVEVGNTIKNPFT